MFHEWELYEQTRNILGTASQKGDIVLFMYINRYNTWTVYNPIRDVRFMVTDYIDGGYFKKIEGVVE